jgi:hypothetical protein
MTRICSPGTALAIADIFKEGVICFNSSLINMGFLMIVLTPFIEGNTFLNSCGYISKAERKHTVIAGSAFFISL